MNDAKPPVRDSIITTLSLYRSLATPSLVAIEVNHGYTRDEVLDELATMILLKLVDIQGGSMRLLVQIPEEEIPAEYLAKADAYRRARNPTGYDRLIVAISNTWHRVWSWFDVIRDRIMGGLVLLVVTAFFALGLCAGESRWVVAEVTAYCPCGLCCGDSADGLTANMTRVDRVPYAFAADRSLPFGARVFVPVGLGVLDQVRAADRWFVIDDRGGALDTEARRYGVLRLDLRVREHAWAVRFGRRSLPVYVTTNP